MNGLYADLGTSGSLSAALKTHEHDDIWPTLRGVPDRHTRVQQLAEFVENWGLDDPALAESRSHVLKIYGSS